MINVENGVISLSFVSETMEGMAFNAGDALLTFEVSPIVKLITLSGSTWPSQAILPTMKAWNLKMLRLPCPK